MANNGLSEDGDFCRFAGKTKIYLQLLVAIESNFFLERLVFLQSFVSLYLFNSGLAAAGSYNSIYLHSLRTLFHLILISQSAVANADINHPPQDGDYEPHENHPVPFEDAKTNDLAKDQLHNNLKDFNILAKIEVKKFYRPPMFHPYYPLLHRPHQTPETSDTEEDSSNQNDKTQIPEDAQPYDQVADSANIEIDEFCIDKK